MAHALAYRRVVLRTTATMLMERGYDLVAFHHGVRDDSGGTDPMFRCDDGVTLSDGDVDRFLAKFDVATTAVFDCVMEGVVPDTKDRKSFVSRLDRGTRVAVYLVNDGAKLGKAPIVKMLDDAVERGVTRLVVPLAKSHTSHTTREIANARFDRGIDVQLIEYAKLRVPLSHHCMSPRYRVMSDDEVSEHLATHKLTGVQQLPRLLDSDPQARYYGLQAGWVVEIWRPTKYFRLVIHDVNAKL